MEEAGPLAAGFPLSDSPFDSRAFHCLPNIPRASLKVGGLKRGWGVGEEGGLFPLFLQQQQRQSNSKNGSTAVDAAVTGAGAVVATAVADAD